ncbi:MAG: nucleotidyltransferase domain-containing protein, partial [Chloroflexota bacterium]
MPADPESVVARPRPTPYPDVNEVLGYFLSSIETILAPRFLGMYLSGSLALGDFAPRRSDIDFVVMTDAELPEDLFSSLRAMHARFNVGDSPWATEVEAVYIARKALRRHDPRQAIWPHIQRGKSNVLEMDLLDSGWVIQRHILREQGVVLAGP